MVNNVKKKNWKIITLSIKIYIIKCFEPGERAVWTMLIIIVLH